MKKIDKIGIALLTIYVIAGFTLMSKATWDVTTPAGSEAMSNGDDRIREFKTDIQTALRYSGSFPSTNTTSPVYIPQIATVTTALRPSGSVFGYAGRQIVNTSSACLEQYDGTTWGCLDVTPALSVDPTNLSTSAYGRGLASDGSGVRVSMDTTSFTLSGGTWTLATSFITSINAPKFHVQLSSNSSDVTGDGTVYRIAFSSVMYDTASGFSTTNYVYTIPVTGYYQFTAAVLLGDVNGSSFGTDINLRLNTSRGVYDLFIGTTVDAGHYVMNEFANTMTMKLYASDTVYVDVRTTNASGLSKTTDVRGFPPQGSNATYFEGRLVP